MLPSQAAMIFSIVISIRLDAILNPLRVHPAGTIRGELRLNSALRGSNWRRRELSTRFKHRDRRISVERRQLSLHEIARLRIRLKPKGEFKPLGGGKADE